MSDERSKDRGGWGQSESSTTIRSCYNNQKLLQQSEGSTRYYKVLAATRRYSILVSLMTYVYVSILVSLMSYVYYCLTCVYAPLPEERGW